MWTTEIHLKHLLTPHTPVIKNIVLEIIRECGDLNVERKFVTYLVHLLALQFKDIENDEKFDREAIENLIEMCMNLIIGKFPTQLYLKISFEMSFLQILKIVHQISL